MDEIAVFGLVALLAMADCSGLPLYPRGYDNRSVVARAALQTPDGKVAHHVIERGPARLDPKTHRIEQTWIFALRLESAPPSAAVFTLGDGLLLVQPNDSGAAPREISKRDPFAAAAVVRWYVRNKYKHDWNAPVQLRAASSVFESTLLRIVPCRAVR